MQNRTAFLSVALVVGLAATPVLAADPPPPLTCTALGFDVSTDGLEYGSDYTKITYALDSADADHVGTFVRAEAGAVMASGSASQTQPCGGDSVFGIEDNLICHETIVRFNNKQTKSNTFTLQANGRRLPITTSLLIKKGKNIESCPIVGLGLEDSTGDNGCVESCGNFDENQSVRKIEQFKFKNCWVTFEFDLTTGRVESFDTAPVVGSGANCSKTDGPVSDIFLSGGIIGYGDDDVTHGDGWISSGQNSCVTRFVGGRYYSFCQ